MDLQIGIIGAGIHGSRYLKHAAEDVEGLRPVAICRRDPDAGAALARQYDCRDYRTARDLLADPQVEGVIIATPPSTHFPFAVAALGAGKAVLLEKPATGTLAEARQLAEIADAPGAPPLMVAQTLRWNPVLVRLRSRLPEIGRVHMFRIAQRLEPTPLAWQRDPDRTVGGSVLLTGVHLFDTVRYISGREFVEVDSRQARIKNPAVEDLFLARARLDDGAFVSMEVSKFGRSRSCHFEAVGEDGQLLGDYYHGGIRLIRGGEVETIDVSAATPTLPAVLEAWCGSWRNGERPPVTMTDGLRTLEIVDACYRSASTGASTSL